MAVAVPYCTEAQMNRRFSASGVNQYSDHNYDGNNDTDVVNDAIDAATEEINMYCLPRTYTAALLATSAMIERWCVDLAVCYLCENRGNPPPDSIMASCERIREKLEKVLRGQLDIPGLAFSKPIHLNMYNLEVDRRYRNASIRTEQETSVPNNVSAKNATRW